MNELDKALADFIRQTIAGAGQLKDFVVAELPDYVQQLLQWYMVKQAIMFGIGAVSAAFLNLEWLQIWIAPKVWLVEYASGLVK